MIGIFSSVSHKVKFSTGKVTIDEVSSKWHHKFTFIILIGCCLLVTSTQYFGDAINCIQDGGVAQNVLDQYCFISATFSVPAALTGTIGQNIAHIGVGPSTPQDEVTYHNYYQWVPFVLFLQAVMFYTPHWIWKNVEGGKIKNIIGGLNVRDLTVPAEAEKQTEIVARYFKTSLHSHSKWAFSYFFCEVLNFVNVIGQIYFTDKFLGGTFLKYGSQVWKFLNDDPEMRVDPMARVFPRMTKCTFYKYGASGTLQKHDSLCLLALNIINEKIYVFLWFWFVILSVMTGIALIYGALTIFLKPLQKREMSRGRQAAVLSEKILNYCNVGDWLLLKFLSKNILDQRVYLLFLEKLEDALITNRNHKLYGEELEPLDS